MDWKVGLAVVVVLAVAGIGIYFLVRPQTPAAPLPTTGPNAGTPPTAIGSAIGSALGGLAELGIREATRDRSATGNGSTLGGMET